MFMMSSSVAYLPSPIDRHAVMAMTWQRRTIEHMDPCARHRNACRFSSTRQVPSSCVFSIDCVWFFLLVLVFPNDVLGICLLLLIKCK